MHSTRENGNCNNNSEMENEFDNSTDDKVCVYETVVSGRFINEELYDTGKQRSNDNYVSIKHENIDDRTVVGFINEESCDTEYKQGSIYNYVTIKDENIDDPTVVIPETELITDCIEDKVYLNETIISVMKGERESIQNYLRIKDENIDYLTVVAQDTKLRTDYIDNKVCVYETIISGGYIKQEPCGMKDEQGSIQNYPSIEVENVDDLTVVAQENKLGTAYIDNKVCIYETIVSGGYTKKEPCDAEKQSGNIRNNVSMKGCEECGEEYDLYCCKCPMLIRIFNSNNPDGRDNTNRWTLPKNLIDICETPSCVGIVALRAIPNGVVFGPFKGLDSTKGETGSKWKLKNKELVYTKDPSRLNWMQYIRRADRSCPPNLTPFQYEDALYYRSDCHISMGDKLLVCWNSDNEENMMEDMQDCYWEPQVCASLDDSYACTFCCVGYKSISHLKAHNSTCIEKRNKKDFCKEIVQCDICKIYLDKKEYSDYHMDRCFESNGKCVLNSRSRRNRRPLKTTTRSKLKQHVVIHNDDKPFACSLCPYKTTRKLKLKQHIAVHNDDRPFACTLCSYKATTDSNLKKHIAIHSDDKQFACSLCPYKTTRNSQLKRHIGIHSSDRPFVCTLCPYKAKKAWTLKQHIAVHNGDKPYTCSFCPYKAMKAWTLKQHVAVHNGDKPFTCTVCPYKTVTKLSLKQHIAVHNDDRPFACSLCPYKATTKSNLKMHIAIHNCDKPFACTLCPYKATRKADLKLHIAIHNGDKSFACALCPYKTTTKSILKLHHTAVHSDHRPFACTRCPYKTARKADLKRHIATHR